LLLPRNNNAALPVRAQKTPWTMSGLKPDFDTNRYIFPDG
jgi:hypothetical protein